jgi:predicted SnoaL-like aldol condensation-catalyzing enzyme
MTDSAQANRAVVLQLLHNVADGDVEAAMELVHRDFVEHNPAIGRDHADLRGYLQAVADHKPPPQITIARTVAENDLVVVHLLTDWNGARPSTAAIDIFRLSDGLIAEHWDVVQQLPSRPGTDS